MSPVSDAEENTTISEALATTLTAISTPSRGSDSNIDQMSQAQADVGTIIGAVVPVIILLLAVAVLTLALVHLARKYKRVTKNKEMRIAMAQNVNALDIDMNSNDSYAPSRTRSRLDSMESNAAYSGATVNQSAGNNLYETIDTSAEDITQACGAIEIQNEEDITDSIYEYIEKADRYV